MKTPRFRTWCAAACLLASGWLSAQARPSDDDTLVPRDYRSWTHVSSSLIGPSSPVFKPEGGIHHIYANEKAMEGLKTGKYPEGATLVYDLLETKEAKGVTTEGARRRIDLMFKDATRGKDSGGWFFQRVLGDNWREDVLKPDERAGCFKCHANRKDKDHVFSVFRK